MSEIYLRQKKVSQLTRVTEENDDAGVAGRSNPRTPRSGTISRDFMRRKTPAG